MKSSLYKLTEILKKANELLIDISGLLSDNERNFIQESLDSRAILTPILLIKDHKKPNKNGYFPTRLIVPATNLTSSFPRIGCIGIKEIKKKKINYYKKTIIRASELKETVEKLNLRKENTTTRSLDIVSMYPLITFKMVKKQ